MFPFFEEDDWLCERCGTPTLHGNQMCEVCELDDFLTSVLMRDE